MLSAYSFPAWGVVWRSEEKAFLINQLSCTDRQGRWVRGDNTWNKS